MVQIKKDKYILGQSLTKQIATMGEEIRLDLQLQPVTPIIGATVEGKVVDQNAAPLANALVKIMDSNYEPLLHAVTDANGNYIFNNIPSSSSYSIFAIASGMKLNQGQNFSLAEGQSKTFNFTLQADPAMQLGILAGDLYQTGTTTPINGAVVSLYSVVNGVETLSAITYTNQYGQFAFREVATGNYDINISALGYLPTSISTSMVNAAQIISLQPTLAVDPNAQNGTVSGIITNNLNAPIDRADVILYRVNADNTLTPVAFTKTNASGVYLFINVPQGNYKVKSNELEIVEVNIPPTYPAGPDLDRFVLAQAASVVPVSSSVANGVLANGAILAASNPGFVDLIGNTNNGSSTVTLDVPLTGSYALAVKYLSGTSTRPLRITVNGVVATTATVSPSGDWISANAATFTTSIVLVAGTNTIQFSGDNTTSPAPALGSFTLDMNAFSQTVLAPNITLASGAIINATSGFINNIGGANQGTATATVNAPLAGQYTITLSYYANTIRPLLVDVNNVNTGTTYQVPISTDTVNPAQFNVNVTLNQGNNTIKFYNNDITNPAPDIKQIVSLQSQYLVLTEAENATLQGGATINNGFVQNIGGNPNGSVSITDTVPYTGIYDFIISYVASATKTGHILVNGTDTGVNYSFEPTASMNIADVKTKVIRLTLTAGNNTIKFI